MAGSIEHDYDFTLLLDGATELTDGVEDALFVAGCDDATLSLRFGCLYLTFSRRAASFKDAVLSAIRDVKKAKIVAGVRRVDESGLVTQAEIARRIDRTRQLVNQFIAGTRGPGSFPPPACSNGEGVSLWDWCEVAVWLRRHDMISEETFSDVDLIAPVNTLLELEWQKTLARNVVEEIVELIRGEASAVS